MNTEGQDCGVGAQSSARSDRPGDRAPTTEFELSVADRWIISRLQRAERAVCDALDGYRFDHAAQAIYEFTWNEYCDWYLELSKPVLTGTDSNAEQLRGTRRTLVQVLETLLRLTHPIMPFITEEIWQTLKPLVGKSSETLMHEPYPVADESKVDAAAEDEMEWVMQFILGIRKIKGEMNIAPGKPVPVLLANTSDKDQALAKKHRHYLDFLARTESIEVLPPDDHGPESATALVGEMKALIPLAGLIDKQAELKRLEKEIGRLQSEIERVSKKLNNPSFVDKAPEAVVQKERGKLAESEKALGSLQAQLEKIRAL